MRNRFFKVLFAVMVMGLLSCEENDRLITNFEDQLEKDQKVIDDYLAANNIDAEIDPTYGLRYVIHEQGDGEFPIRTDSVTVGYSGRKINREEPFETNDEISFFLGGVIVGWQIGLQLIQEGGDITLYIPSGYAYGQNGSGGNIGPNANLVFRVELKEIK